MAGEEKKPEEQKETPSTEVDLFSQSNEIQPLREVDEGEDDLDTDGDGEESLEERMEGGRKLTDFQTLSKVLNPNFGYSHLNLVAIGRTFPDVYNFYFSILVKGLIKRSLALGKPIRIDEAIAIVNTALSKSIDGEGIIDNIVAYTKGHQEVTTEQNKGIGLQ